MIKSIRLNKFIFSIGLIVISSIVNILTVRASGIQEILISQNNSNSTRNNQIKLPTPPQTGTPKGHQTPGATRPNNLCPQVNQSLTALIANKGKDYTLSAYPTFWFYIPYQPSAIKYLEFALKNPQTNNTIYRTAIEPQNSSGMIKITIPPEEKFALQEGNNYTWELILSCQGNETYEPDVIVNGWIQKLAKNTELQAQIKQLSTLEAYQFYLDNEVWYDAINQIAELYFNKSENAQVNQAWLNLLAVLEPEWLNLIENEQLNVEQKDNIKQKLLNLLAVLKNPDKSKNLLVESVLLSPDL